MVPSAVPGWYRKEVGGKMGESKPVKVSAALYEQLKQQAAKQDITIQQTLKSTLDANHATIE